VYSNPASTSGGIVPSNSLANGVLNPNNAAAASALRMARQ
jgi:hypothetical protein